MSDEEDIVTEDECKATGGISEEEMRLLKACS